MVRFSKKEDYAIILVTTLADKYNKGLVSLSEIAKSYNLSLLFLRNVANDLRHNGIIRAEEGKYGGYQLVKDPKTLKVGEILKSFSTEPLLACCQSFSDIKISEKKSKIHEAEKCPQQGFCRAGYVWRKLNREFLDRISNLSVIEFMNYK
jgi:Rrf2 family protein